MNSSILHLKQVSQVLGGNVTQVEAMPATGVGGGGLMISPSSALIQDGIQIVPMKQSSHVLQSSGLMER